VKLATSEDEGVKLAISEDEGVKLATSEDEEGEWKWAIKIPKNGLQIIRTKLNEIKNDPNLAQRFMAKLNEARSENEARNEKKKLDENNQKTQQPLSHSVVSNELRTDQETQDSAQSLANGCWDRVCKKRNITNEKSQEYEELKKHWGDIVSKATKLADSEDYMYMSEVDKKDEMLDYGDEIADKIRHAMEGW
jgi:hypothetical protein